MVCVAKLYCVHSMLCCPVLILNDKPPWILLVMICLLFWKYFPKFTLSFPLPSGCFPLFVLPSEVSGWNRLLLKYIYAILDAPILLPVLFVLLTYEMFFWIFLSIILHSSKFTELEIKPLVSFSVL